eukprot:5581528-Pleurochrysis_carterae.AAC.1
MTLRSQPETSERMLGCYAREVNHVDKMLQYELWPYGPHEEVLYLAFYLVSPYTLHRLCNHQLFASLPISGTGSATSVVSI